MNNTENKNNEENNEFVLDPVITNSQTIEQTEETTTKEEIKEEKKEIDEVEEAKRSLLEEERMRKERELEAQRLKKEEEIIKKRRQQEEEKNKKREEQKRLREEKEQQRIREQAEEKKKKEEEKQKKIEERLEYKRKKAEIKKERKLQDIRNHASFFRILLILSVIVMAGYVYYSTMIYHKTINNLKEQCTPFKIYDKETNLDVNSTLIQSLYKKVYTTMKEDYAQPEWNNIMKLYLAYRQIGENEKYDSNCNMFDAGRMEPYECDESKNFVPKAFHQSALILEYKKLFGENAEIKLDNIKLTNSCIGGYEYIKEREEFVQGRCTQQQTNNYKVTKTLKEAIAKRDTIVLVEEVMYKEGESMELPEYLKNGKYYYTFRLDMNYNFILISKKYEDEY